MLERGVKRVKERFQRGSACWMWYQVRIKKETKRLVKNEGKEENL
jgi:23S rRNA A2030 N6-methylase RlmJ